MPAIQSFDKIVSSFASNHGSVISSKTAVISPITRAQEPVLHKSLFFSCWPVNRFSCKSHFICQNSLKKHFTTNVILKDTFYNKTFRLWICMVAYKCHGRTKKSRQHKKATAKQKLLRQIKKATTNQKRHDKPKKPRQNKTATAKLKSHGKPKMPRQNKKATVKKKMLRQNKKATAKWKCHDD